MTASTLPRTRARTPLPPQPLVSIVLTAYGHARLLEETLASIEAQTYPNIEIVLVDDGSPDDSAAVAERMFERSRFRTKLIRQANTGMAKARGIGYAASSGPLVCFFDDDDVMLPTKIADQVQDLLAHDADGVLGGFIWIDPAGRHVPYNGHPQFLGHWDQAKFEQAVVCSRGPHVAGGLFRRDIVDAIGGPDQGLPMNDWPFLIEYARASRGLRVHRTPVYLYRLHAASFHVTRLLDLLEWKRKTVARYCPPHVQRMAMSRAHRLVAEQFLLGRHRSKAFLHFAKARWLGPQKETGRFFRTLLGLHRPAEASP